MTQVGHQQLAVSTQAEFISACNGQDQHDAGHEPAPKRRAVGILVPAPERLDQRPRHPSAAHSNAAQQGATPQTTVYRQMHAGFLPVQDCQVSGLQRANQRLPAFKQMLLLGTPSLSSLNLGRPGSKPVGQLQVAATWRPRSQRPAAMERCIRSRLNRLLRL